jgi:hypothetical protein
MNRLKVTVISMNLSADAIGTVEANLRDRCQVLENDIIILIGSNSAIMFTHE